MKTEYQIAILKHKLNSTMLISDVRRLSPQQRALFCYVGLSLWIFLLVAGTYKYMGSEDDGDYRQSIIINNLNRDSSRNLKRDIKNRKIFSICNHPDDISLGSEGLLNPSRWNLQGVLLFTRHGDRGPLAHVRNASGVNCGLSASEETNTLLTQFKMFIQNTTLSGHVPWTHSGMFRDFPLLPTSEKHCGLAELTYVGIAQLLNTGRFLRHTYLRRLSLDNATADDVTAYSTTYRRTFQSALALLYGFLPTDLLSKTMIQESQSLAFCFTDCSCPAADHYRRLVKSETDEHLVSHPAVTKLVHHMASIVYEQPEQSLLSDPHVLRDALLTYVCHDAPLPCAESARCVKPEHVASLFAYTDWETRQYARNIHLKRSCTLKAYGLIRNIVTQMLKMISEGKPKIALYSGHDWTLHYLSTALGIKNDNTMTQYASRLVIEVYRDLKAEGSQLEVIKHYYFRLVANGKDVTKDIHFCKGATLLNLTGPRVCRIEAIIRYIHDNYFSTLNATNFKDACRL